MLLLKAKREIIPPMINSFWSRWWVAFILLFISPATSLAQQVPANDQPLDFPALVRELLQSPNKPGYAGLVWWAPPAFWEASMTRSGIPAAQAHDRVAPLRRYTMILVAVGKIGIGTIDWVSEQQIRDSVRLRDANGNVYEPLPQVSGDAAGLASLLKPTLSNILGPTGQGTQILFFPGVDKKAQLIADPLAPGSFSVVLTNLLGEKESTFKWTLPLTTLSPPKYCPVGGEVVQANWKYCPWHGNKLDQPVPSVTPSSPTHN